MTACRSRSGERLVDGRTEEVTWDKEDELKLKGVKNGNC